MRRTSYALMLFPDYSDYCWPPGAPKGKLLSDRWSYALKSKGSNLMFFRGITLPWDEERFSNKGLWQE